MHGHTHACVFYQWDMTKVTGKVYDVYNAPGIVNHPLLALLHRLLLVFLFSSSYSSSPPAAQYCSPHTHPPLPSLRPRYCFTAPFSHSPASSSPVSSSRAPLPAPATATAPGIGSHTLLALLSLLSFWSYSSFAFSSRFYCSFSSSFSFASSFPASSSSASRTPWPTTAAAAGCARHGAGRWLVFTRVVGMVAVSLGCDLRCDCATLAHTVCCTRLWGGCA